MENNSYKRLNDAVNEVFFGGRYQLSPVYLDLEDDVRIDIANILVIDESDFDGLLASGVSATLCWNKTNIYSWHKENLLTWRATDLGTPPPMSALLLAFSLAAERMREGAIYSANNYYQRLSEIFLLTDESKKSRVRAAGKHTLIFWKMLNRWLVQNDYEYGRPTSRQVNNWRYVSYALSQSLVRDADRKRLHGMFSHYGFSSHETLSESEIRLYLHEWMASTGPTQWLKKLWSVSDLRERVVTAAINELNEWEEEFPNTTGHENATKKLNWAAVIENFPRLRVRLYLATSTNIGNETVDLTVVKCSTELANNIDKDCDHFWLAPLLGTEIAYLGPVAKLNLNRLLLNSFELVSEARNRKYGREARAVIPLAKQEGSSIYREVVRISLHTNHLILCHKNWEDAVKHYLDKHATLGFSIRRHPLTVGLPPEWVLVQDVELDCIPSDKVQDNLQCLVPLSEGVNIYLSGGLKLAPFIWHAKAPPEVFASNDDGLLGVTLRAEDGFGVKGKTLCEQEASSYDPSFLGSTQFSLESQHLVIVPAGGKRSRVEKEISFRSAVTPRKLSLVRDKELRYSLDEKLKKPWGFSASPVEGAEECAVFLKGMVFTGEVRVGHNFVSPNEYKLLGVEHGEEEDQPTYKMQPVEGVTATCILRGYHYWICAADSSSMTCKDCRAFQIARRLKRRNRREEASQTPSHPNQPVSIQKRTCKAITPDIAYDAICYLGAGSYGRLQSIISVFVDLPWEAVVTSRRLVDLGHLDVMLDSNSHKSSRWYCTQPAIVLTPGGDAFFSGFRNDKLLKQVQESFANVTCSYRREPQESAPTAHLWELGTTDLGELESQLDDVLDPHGRPVKVVEFPAETIITAMPSVTKIMQCSRPIHLEDRGDIERFDPFTGKWQQAKLNGRGGYRTYFAGRRYFYHDDDGNSIEGELQLIKLLAARDAGVVLHGYNNSSGCFECVVGCEPPGLYRRALVSCSGVLPLLENGKHLFHGVPPKLATLLMYKLYK